MGKVSRSFYTTVLQRVGAPVTVQNLQACNAWEVAEGGTAAYNPWNTTLWMPGATPYNTFGNGLHVYNYPSASVGMLATIDTLTNGHYANILTELREGNSGLSVCRAVDASVWGTKHSAAVYADLYPPPPRTLYLTTPYMRGPDVVIVQHALERLGFSVGPTGADGIYGPSTVSAVRRFQISRGLAVDGITGPLTRRALGI